MRALESRRIPHVLVGGRSLHDREEIIALRNALAAIEWPDDELKVFATLRGPLFALSDEALLAFRQYVASDGILQIRRLHPMHPVDRGHLDPVAHEVADALALLARLHAGRNQRPLAQTIMMLLDAVRAHAGIALWPIGEQALANCLRLVDLAHNGEGGYGIEPQHHDQRHELVRARGDRYPAERTEWGCAGAEAEAGGVEQRHHTGGIARHRNELVRFDAKPARLNSEERSWPKGLLEEEGLVINEPIGEWSCAVRSKIMSNRLNRLEGTKDVQFLAEDCVLGAAKTQERLCPQNW